MAAKLAVLCVVKLFWTGQAGINQVYPDVGLVTLQSWGFNEPLVETIYPQYKKT